MRGALALIFGVLFVASTADAAETPRDLATRGQQIMAAKGCYACHSTDGKVKTGPTFTGIWGRKRPVNLANIPGGATDIVADEAYLVRSIRDPDAEVVIGYSPKVMPKYDISDDEAAAIVEALHHPEAIDESRARRGGTLIPLIGCCAAFVLLHFLLSAAGVKRQLQLAIGAKGFGAVYSLIALASFTGMIVFYRTAPFIELWSPPRWTRWTPVLVMPLALLLLVAGFSTPSPTAAGQDTNVKDARPIGILAITRHPAMWGFALWALSHLMTNGEVHVILVAASIFILAIGGAYHIDLRRKAALGADWDAYASKTSLLPFAAIAKGRVRLVPSEIGIRRVLVAAVLYMLLFFAHPHVIGASPSP